MRALEESSQHSIAEVASLRSELAERSERIQAFEAQREASTALELRTELAEAREAATALELQAKLAEAREAWPMKRTGTGDADENDGGW